MVAIDFNIEQKKQKIDGQIILLNHMLKNAGRKEQYELTKHEAV